MTGNGQHPQPPAADAACPGVPPPAADAACPGVPPPAADAACPGAPVPARSFEDEIHSAVEYERGLAVKALLSIALVALVLVLRVAFFG